MSTNAIIYKLEYMKKAIITFCVILSSIATSFSQEEEVLKYQYDPVTDKGIGFVNSKGEIVIPADHFGFVYSSHLEKIAFVLFKEGPKGIYAINRKAEPLFEVFCCDNGPDESKEGVFRIIENGKMGFANMDGEIVIKPQFDFVWPFQECGYAIFCMGGKKVNCNTLDNHWRWEGGKRGIINKEGKIVLAPTYDNGNASGFIVDGKHVTIEDILGLTKQ